MSAEDPPSGVVTFLFTDIEGSTRRWEADAAAMRVALVRHDEVLRIAIEEHEGFLFSQTGDGVVAAFASPKSAVDAAVAAQRTVELPVRMGIATGEAELRGGDYFGTVLNRAARVMAAGHGGQVLVADSTAGLLNGIDLTDLGPRKLRDLPDPITVYQLGATGLRTDFPPLRTLDASPGNLRPSVTRFIGRETEVGEVEAALRAHRLVTLTGVGGVGKTRLALEVANRLADEFPDGVWVFELAAVTDPAAVPDAVAAVLGIIQQPAKTVTESVAAALEDRVRLLVVDNCEHVLDAVAGLLAAILASSASVRVVATSREGLGVDGEQLWPVRPLNVDAAVDLFIERSHRVAPAFSADDATTVAEICRRLDGIPLAIELAASRISSMTVEEIRDRLDHRFKLLVGSRRRAGRHQTLRHAVAWSFDLLDGVEKALLERCSVFAGGFDLEGACAIAGPDEPDDYAILDLLDSLVRKSLLVADRSSGQTRFWLLETIRQFAEEQLADNDGVDEARTTHARYFAGHVNGMLALWDGPRQRDAYTWLTTEFANLRVAFRWSARNADLDTAATLATRAAFLGIWVEQYEAVGWAEELLEPARSIDHRRLLQLYVAASQCYAAGRVDDAFGYLEASQKLVGRTHFDADLYESQTSSGIAYVAAGRPERWAEVCRDAIARRSGPQTVTRAALVMALYFLGDNAGATTASEGLLAAADATANPNTACFALLAIGTAYRDVDPVTAYDVLRRALTVARESGNRQMEAATAVTLSMVAATNDDHIDSLDHLALAIRHYLDAGSLSLIHFPLASLVGAFDRLGRHEQAATVSGFATNPVARAGYPQIDVAIAHLRDILGEQKYEACARAGERMSIAAIATYALAEIKEARAEANAASK